MKYNKFHKLIEENNSEQKQAAYEGLKAELNISDAPAPAEKPASKWRNFIKKPYRLIACLSAALAAVCLAIVLPITLNNTVQPPAVRYRSSEDCLEILIDYSLKEYGEINGIPYLYIDWYDFADEVQTKLYVSEDDSNDLIYAREMLVNGETGSIVILYTTDLYTRVDILDDYLDICTIESIVREVKVFWYYNNRKNSAYFEYGDYRYFIELNYPLTENSILEIIDSMLP